MAHWRLLRGGLLGITAWIHSRDALGLIFSFRNNISLYKHRYLHIVLDWKPTSRLLLLTYARTLRTWWQASHWCSPILQNKPLSHKKFILIFFILLILIILTLNARCRILLEKYGFHCYNLSCSLCRVLRFENWPLCKKKNVAHCCSTLYPLLMVKMWCDMKTTNCSGRKDSKV